MMSKTTLRDVAAHLDLSPALVSRVLNEKPGVWASEATKRRVFEAARALDYRPSSSAQALATGRSMQLALLVEMTSSSGSAVAASPDVHGLLDAAARGGYRVVLLPLQSGAAGERQLEELARDRFCDGVCLFSAQLSASHLRVLASHNIPAVVIGDLGEDQIADELASMAARVDHDNYRYAFDSVRWLHEQGHHRIAWAMPPGETGLLHNQRLLEGYYDGMLQIGATPQLLPHFDQPGQINACLRERDFSAVIVRYPHAVYSWLYHASIEGVRVPDQLTILGHVDVSECGEFVLSGLNHNIAFHCSDSHRAGERAGEILMRWAKGNAPTEPLTLIQPHSPNWGAPSPRSAANGVSS